MKLVKENINEAIKHLGGRSKKELLKAASKEIDEILSHHAMDVAIKEQIGILLWALGDELNFEQFEDLIKEKFRKKLEEIVNKQFEEIVFRTRYEKRLSGDDGDDEE